MRPLERILEIIDTLNPVTLGPECASITMAATLHFNNMPAFGPLWQCTSCSRELDKLCDHHSPVVREIADALLHYGGKP